MELTQMSKTEFRFGEYGPGYMLRGPRTDFGVVQLRPGDDAANHYHAKIEESFVVTQGSCTVWIDCEKSFELTVGDVVRCDPGELHYFVNNSEELFQAVFVKAPYDPHDGVQVPWVPGEPVPTEAIAQAKAAAAA